MSHISRQVSDWIEERLEVRPLLRHLLDRKVPGGVGWFYTLGSATLVAFILLVITGIFLAMNYSPSPEHAWDSVQYITQEVAFGSLIRGIHHWAASAMVVLVLLHGLRVFFMGAYKYPRELTWVVGVFLLLLVLASSFTGDFLPWDQKAYWATTVGTEMANSIPWVGDFLLKVLRGGTEMRTSTLTRFYTFHLAVLPSLIALLIGIHLFMVVKQGISAPPER